jgi:adenine-specific DNA-methyltransferase
MPTLDFKGKSFVHAHHLSVPFRELVIDAKKSLPAKGQKPSLDDNLIIHGDNLHALKALLPVYAGKVDCIFIDPPYNTGNEGWCYNDNVRSPLMREWLKKSANPVEKEDLERHDKWLSMIWPRIKLLHELLSDNGSLWVTLDDNEIHHARSLFDEIFGEDSFVGQLVWQKRTSRENRAPLSSAHDHLLLYTKSTPDAWKLHRNLLDPTEEGYANPDNDKRGKWKSIPFSAQGFRKNQVYDIITPSGKVLSPPRGRCWGATEPEFKRLRDVEKRIYFPKDGDGRPRVKQFPEDEKGLVPMSIWFAAEVGDTEASKKEILEIFEDSLPFDTPKPTKLIQRVVQISTHKDSIVLDSFAGSGTTAHAVLAQNKKDNGNRKFILVETEDYADKLTAERVRRVINGYKFKGTQREELLREPLTWTRLKKANELIEKAESFELLDKHRFDRILKTVENGELEVIGEKNVTEKVEGLGGSFTYVTLGTEMSLDKLLADGLPTFEALAKYVFFTATGRTLSELPKQKAAGAGFIGETDLYRVHLLYQPNKKWLQSNEAALTEKLVDEIVATNTGKKKLLVFGAAKFMSQRELSRLGVDFCQLPYAIHRILGD